MPTPLRTLIALTSLLLLAPAAATEAEDKLPDLEDVQSVLELFLENDPSMEEFFDDAYGYVVFPGVGKGGFGIGGAYGKGAVYVDGVLVGSATLKQATIGFQLGGQRYAQVIFFRNRAAFDDFTIGLSGLMYEATIGGQKFKYWEL